MNDHWLNERIKAMRALKTLNEHQQMLLTLFDKTPRDSEDERKLAALIKAEKANERAMKARATASRILKEERLAQRRARDQMKIVRGALIDWSTLEGRDTGELLGALLELVERGTDTERKRWKARGDALLDKSSAWRAPVHPACQTRGAPVDLSMHDPRS
jgi:hypothetical protein